MVAEKPSCVCWGVDAARRERMVKRSTSEKRVSRVRRKVERKKIREINKEKMLKVYLEG